MHSNLDPSKEGSRFISSLPKATPTILCFLGLGALFHLEQYLSLPSLTNQPIILWEPIEEIAENEAFKDKLHQILAQFEIKNIPYLFLKSGQEPAEWKKQLDDFLRLTSILSFSILPFPSYTRHVPQKIQYFSEFLNQFLNPLPATNLLTIAHFKRVWTQNYLKNFELMKSRLENTFWLSGIHFGQKIPIFVGASPLLETQITDLKNDRGKFFLFSSDTAIQFLLSESITPDVILSFDSGRGTLYHFLPNIPITIPIITWLGGLSNLYSLGNKIFIANTNYPLDQILETRLNSLWPYLKNPSLNVAGIGKSLAALGAATKFVLSGVDFKDDFGKSHCRGTGYENYRLPNVMRTNTWESLNQSRLYSKKAGKNRLAEGKLWERSDSMEVVSLEKVNNHIPIQETGKENEGTISLLGFKGFPELNIDDWERAFQEFPDVISSGTFRKWYSA